jgi:Lon protease-like protein
VLLPGALLRLHVFEPRYRALVHDVVESEHHEFGVVLIERGREVGGGDVRRPVGTVARVLEVVQSPDGRFGVLALGVRPLVVEEWLPDDPYPRAEVRDDPDAPADAGEFAALLSTTVPRVRRAAALALELGDTGHAAPDEISDDPSLGSFQLVAQAPLGEVDRYQLLCAGNPVERLVLLDGMLSDVEALLQFRLADGSDQPDG